MMTGRTTIRRRKAVLGKFDKEPTKNNLNFSGQKQKKS